MRLHALLTEDSLRTHPRNREQGREGNREGGGSPSIYLTVPREQLALPAETAHPTAATMDGDFVASFVGCDCPPCPGRGNDGHGMTHCAECCFGSGVEADIDCPIHGIGA